MGSPVTLELRDVIKRVGAETHIHAASLAFAGSGFNILLGTTLAGKTTLLQLLAGLIRPTEGAIRFRGRDVTGMPVQQRNVSMVFQQFINYPNFTVYENIASPLRVGGMPEAKIAARVGAMADLLRLGPLLQRYPAELSGGQQQRTALARALAKDADLILLDEPLANLDYKLREELRDELPRLFAGRNCTVVFATTEPSEAMLLGGHTATLHEGRITAFGPTEDIYNRPPDLLTAQVFSSPPINTAPVIKQAGEIVLSGIVRWPAAGRLAALPDGRYTLAIRPHHVNPTGLDRPDSVAMAGRVMIAELGGSESVIHFAHGDLNWVSQSQGVHAIEVGEEAAFRIDTGRAFYFGADGRRIVLPGEAG